MMNQMQKNNIFEAPEGYFDAFPERILRARKNQNAKVFLARVAAAAILVVAMFLFVYDQSVPDNAALQTIMDQEVEFYINSGYWNAEDVLGFSEDPDELLDLILAEEWSTTTNNNQTEDTFDINP